MKRGTRSNAPIVSSLAIASGTLRGRKVFFADRPDLRPTPARVREAVFSMLRPYLASHGFLDICAGSGVMGFEAASIGFRPVVLTDSNPEIILDLEENRRKLGPELRVATCSALALHLLNLEQRPWLIYADPPFRLETFHDELLGKLANASFLAPGSLYVAEHEAERQFPERFSLVKQKRYGRTRITILAIPD